MLDNQRKLYHSFLEYIFLLFLLLYPQSFPFADIPFACINTHLFIAILNPPTPLNLNFGFFGAGNGTGLFESLNTRNLYVICCLGCFSTNTNAKGF